MGPDITAFFDDATNTISYIVRDPNGSSCAIIDSVLDFDFASGRTDTRSADKLVSFVRDNNLDVQWLLESHVHADHLSAAPYIQMKVGGKIGIGSRITDVQETFGKIFNEGTEFQRDGSQFDELFVEGDTFHIGQLRGDVLHTPGHTPACMTYVIEDAAFVGDTLFMPDFGTARCDFPGGSSEKLFSSIQKILALPDSTRIFVGHDYKAPGRENYAWESTVGEQTKVTTAMMILDSYKALDKLSEHPNIDSKRAALTGWSLGGGTALLSGWNPLINAINPKERFAAHLAYYPPCVVEPENLSFTDAPVHILIGEIDDWTPASACLSLVESAKKVFDAVLSGKFKVEIFKKYSLGDIKKAHEELEARLLTGPAVITP